MEHGRVKSLARSWVEVFAPSYVRAGLMKSVRPSSDACVAGSSGSVRLSCHLVVSRIRR